MTLREACRAARARLQAGACCADELPVSWWQRRAVLRALLATGEVEPVACAGSGRAVVLYRISPAARNSYRLGAVLGMEGDTTP